MSEEISTIRQLAYLIGMIPSAYFLYRILKEVYHILIHSDEDIL